MNFNEKTLQDFININYKNKRLQILSEYLIIYVYEWKKIK